VTAWLNTLNPIESTPRSVAERVGRLAEAGFEAMDAYHLAWAQYLQADVLVTTDDRFLSQFSRFGDIMKTRVLNPVTLAAELVT
jgi:predicted nucleic acid-binding protein